jgi:hypothetical protein
MRGDRPFLFTNIRGGAGVPELTAWVRGQMAAPERRKVVTAGEAMRPAGHSHSH